VPALKRALAITRRTAELGLALGPGYVGPVEARAQSKLCHVGKWIFPRAACEPLPVTSP